MQELNAQLWNLGTTSLVAALGLGVAACGPVVGLEGDTEGGETEGSSETIIDPSTPSETDPPPECPLVECGDEWICEDEPCDIDPPDCYDEDYDYGCYCVYGHCSPDYDCYDDGDCGPGELCAGYDGYDGCDPVQSLSDCGTPAAWVGTPIQIPDGPPIQSLSFVDLDPDTPGEDLVAGTDLGGWLIPSGGEAAELPSEGPLRGATSTDLDGDGTTELIVIDDAGLTVHYAGDSPQSVTLATKQLLTSVHTLENIEGIPSVVVLDAAGNVSIIAGSSERTLELTQTRMPIESTATILPFSIGDGSSGIAWDGSSADLPLLHVPSTGALDTFGERSRSGLQRSMVVGALTGSERSDVLWASHHYTDWTLLEISIGGEAPEQRAIYFNYETIATGDLDGNGFDDVLAMGEGGLAVMPGDAQWGLTCFSQAPFAGGTSRLLAVGDLDGDGLDEAIVVTDAGSPVTQYDVSWTP